MGIKILVIALIWGLMLSPFAYALVELARAIETLSGIGL